MQDIFVQETNKEEIKPDVVIENNSSTTEAVQNVFTPEKTSNEAKKQEPVQDIFAQETNKEEIKLDSVIEKTSSTSETDQNIFTNQNLTKENKTDNTPSTTTDEFSNQFNKLKEEKEILNMNKELSLEGISSEKPYTKYMALLPIFAFFFTSFLGVYLFSLNTKAEGANLIKIEKNNKVGYIDESGNKVVNTKYVSGTDFYKGYAIVKNQNNLSAVINGKGALNSSFGEYFYIERYGSRYIASKFTNEGLKLALLDSNLKELTRYKYDNITYVKNNAFLFTKDDTMGVLNYNGKEVYSYTVDEVDNKNISIEVSKVNDESIKDIKTKPGKLFAICQAF